MMEYGDIGIKDAADVIECMLKGASAKYLYDKYGDRIAGLLAEAFDIYMHGEGSIGKDL